MRTDPEASYSPMRVWLHPRRVSREINGFMQRIAELEGIERQMSNNEEETEKLRVENRDLTNRLAASETEREQLEGRLAQLLDDEAYHREMDARIAEIESEFEKMEFMRQRYENTIATLKERLNGVTDELRRVTGQNSGIIDFDTAPPTIPPSSPSSPARPSSSASVKQSSKHSSTPPDSSGQIPHKSPKSKSPANRDLDWLQSLPDKV